jgi:very-short-patch-repair endonuclease
MSHEYRWMAAVLACGGRAALSHRSAAAYWAILPTVTGRVEVSVPTRGGRATRVGIRLHRSRSLTSEVVVRPKGIPVTTPARTIVDLRQVTSMWQWRRAVRQAEIRGLKLKLDMETDRTRSDLERDFLQLCHRHDIPAPEVNVKVGRWTVDFLWRRERVAVETDYYDYHRGRVAFQDDRARDLDLRRHGFDVHRFSELQVNDQPAEVAADLRDALALSS